MKRLQMKLSLKYWFGFLLLLLLLTLAFSSCARKPMKTEIKETEKITQKESIRFTNKLNTSLAVNDTFKIGVPYFITGSSDKNCDSLCNAKKQEWLSDNVATEKTSGDNNYKFYYDKFNNQLALNVNLGATISQYKDSLAIKETEIKNIKSKIIEIPVKYIPKWCQWLAGIGGLLLFYYLIRIIIFLKTKIPIV